MGQRAVANTDVVAVAGVGPIGGMIDKFGAYGIEMDVAGQMGKVSVAVYVFGFESALIERADALLLFVDGFDVGCAEGLHHLFTDVLDLQVDEDVVMIGHEAVGEDEEKLRLEVVAHLLDEESPVFLAKEDGLAVDAAIVEVVVVAGQQWWVFTGLRSQAF